MNKWIKYAIGAILVFALVLIGYKSCGLYDKYSVLKGQYDALSQEYDDYKEGALANIEELRNIIAQRDEEIRIINSHIEIKEGEIADLHSRTDELEEAYSEAMQDVAKIDNLTKQVSLWKQKFSLAETIIADKDAIIFSLNEKYEAQEKISLEWKTLYENEATLRNLAEVRLKLADKKLRGLRLQVNLGRGITIALGVVLIYGLVAN